MSNEFTLDSLLNSLSDAETEIEKVAQDTEVSVADQLKDTLTKEASASPSNGDTNMSVETGNAIADSILAMLDGGMDKKASTVGEPTPGNNVKEELDKMEAQQDAIVTLTPREGKTVTEVAKSLAAKSKGGEDSVVVDVPAEEGNAGSYAIPSDIEKSASVQELIAEGTSFDDAVEMVKQASAELEKEAHELEKVAAVNALISEGIGFDEAYALVKEASAQMTADSKGYSDLEKSAAVQELMAEDGLSFDEAYALVKEAALAGK